MKRGIIFAMLILSACSSSDEKQAATPVTPAGPIGPAAVPPMPLYQMRDAAPSGDRLAAGRGGAALYSNRCGACHLDMGMGTNLLTKQMMAAKRPPSDGLLANRTDLTSDYVKSVVRMGKNAMPRLSRVEVTDAELDSIAKHLGKADQ